MTTKQLNHCIVRFVDYGSSISISIERDTKIYTVQVLSGTEIAAAIQVLSNAFTEGDEITPPLQGKRP